MTRILVVEDNEDLAHGLRRSLEGGGFEVDVAPDGEGAFEAVRERPPDLVVLDLMLPGRSGYEVLRELRSGGCEVPVLILSARGEEIDKVRGFLLGADDYVVKPIGVLELVARVEAILRRARRTPGNGPEEELTFGDVVVDLRARTVSKSGRSVELTPLEFDLLTGLLRHRGEAVSRRVLLEEVWGYKNPVPTRTVDMHVAGLRAKLEDDPAEPRYILTVRKAGYRLAE